MESRKKGSRSDGGGGKSRNGDNLTESRVRTKSSTLIERVEASLTLSSVFFGRAIVIKSDWC